MAWPVAFCPVAHRSLPGDAWQHLGTFLVVTVVGVVLLRLVGRGREAADRRPVCGAPHSEGQPKAEARARASQSDTVTAPGGGQGTDAGRAPCDSPSLPPAWRSALAPPVRHPGGAAVRGACHRDGCGPLRASTSRALRTRGRSAAAAVGGLADGHVPCPDLRRPVSRHLPAPPGVCVRQEARPPATHRSAGSARRCQAEMQL